MKTNGEDDEVFCIIMPYTNLFRGSSFFDPFKDVFRACIMLPIVQKGWSCQVIYCFNNQWDSSELDLCNCWREYRIYRHRTNTFFNFLFFHFWKMFWRAYSIAKEKREWKTLSNFPTQCVLSRDLTARISLLEMFMLSSSWFPQRTWLPLHPLWNSSFHWIVCEHGDINEPQHETTFSSNCAQRIEFLLMR